MSWKQTTTELHVEARAERDVTGILYIKPVAYAMMEPTTEVATPLPEDMAQAIRENFQGSMTLEVYQKRCSEHYAEKDRKRREENGEVEGLELFKFLENNLPYETFKCLSNHFYRAWERINYSYQRKEEE
jgi:hypothetical protein